MGPSAEIIVSVENTNAAGFFSWEVEGKAVAVELSFDVIDRIGSEALCGLSALPRRGAEIGGILLGAAQPGARLLVRIEDSVPVPCEYAFGPSYALSEREKKAFAAVLRKWQPSASRSVYAVGFYRSHTREDLCLREEDLGLFHTLFQDSSKVALIVRPLVSQPGRAGFFFWEEGTIHSRASYREFLFDRNELGGAQRSGSSGYVVATESQAFPPRPPEDLATRPGPSQRRISSVGRDVPAPQLSASGQETEPDRTHDMDRLLMPAVLSAEPDTAPRFAFRRRPWLSMLLALTIVLVAIWLGLGAEGRSALGLPRPFRDPYALQLEVREYGDNLRLRWNRKARALGEAQRAILIIGDGDQTRSMELDGDQLRSGSVIYLRQGGPVRFRLEVFLKGNKSFSETWEPESRRLATASGEARPATVSH